MKKQWTALLVLSLGVSCAPPPGASTGSDRYGDPGRLPIENWQRWRGPQQNGSSAQTGLPDHIDPTEARWCIDLPGRGTPVIADGRLYAFGYRGEGADLQEVLVCLDANTGRQQWEHGFSDFISDIIYNRYSIGSPAIDPQTGNVYIMTSPGIFACFTRDGEMLWHRSLMEEFGRLTFPNGRTGSPVIDGDLVIVRGITSNWGREGPARDRFYAFDKRVGDLVWSSTPGVGPPFLKDSSFSTPMLATRNGRRLFYAGTGCGNVVCVDARTGNPVWRYQLARGGINSSLVQYKDLLIAIHGRENLDSTTQGRMVALRVGTETETATKPSVLDTTAEAWRNDLGIFTSSPVLVGDRLYQCTAHGDLCCVNAETGEILWKQKLGPDQLHASPLAADGKLYVPMHNGLFFVLRPSDTSAQIVSKVKLAGLCLGSPAIWNGKVYVHTTEKLYCFGGPGRVDSSAPARSGVEVTSPEPSPTRLAIVPSEVRLRPGGRVQFSLRAVDAYGRFVRSFQDAFWSPYIPPSAKVKAKLDAAFDHSGVLVASKDANVSAGAFEATVGNLKGHVRGRILLSPPYEEDFESFTMSHRRRDGIPFSYPPLPWIGARLKWEVRERGGNKVLAKTLDRVLFQRSMVFLGHPDDRNYTISADVLSDGNRRGQSTAGIVNQRYIIALVGNAQILEVSSNHDRVKVSVPFRWKPGIWYRLKTRVDVAPDGSGVVRGKAWARDQDEPPDWTIEVPHANAHQNGSPGLFGLSPQVRFAVYLDNVSVTPNEPQ